LSSSSRPFLLPLLSSLFPYTTLFRSAAHSRQHFYSSQLPLAHLRPPQSDLLSEVLLRGHFYRGQKGTLSSRRNTSNRPGRGCVLDRKSTRLNSSHQIISYAVFCLKKK